MGDLFKVQNLYAGYNKENILKDISFNTLKGEFIGVIGPNGSGKSTLLKVMTRELGIQQGEIGFEGQSIFKMNLKVFCQKVAFVPQDTIINFSFSVEEIVMMGRIPHLRRLQLETKKDFEVAENSLRLTDSLQLKDKNIDCLSAGERQRIIIARALAQEPVLLFLDEPTSHLDITHQIQVLDLLKRLNRKTKLTIIIVLHDLNLAGEYCDRLIMLNNGEIFKDDKPEEVLTYQNIEAVYKTVVVVNKNPISKPYVTLISQEK